MSELKSFNSITPESLRKNGVVALSNTPNRQSTFGIGGLTATQLKEHFDKLSKMLSEHINQMSKSLETEGSKYIAMPSLGDDIRSLEDLATSFSDGSFAELLQLYASAGATGTMPLQDIINREARSISDIIDGTSVVGQSQKAKEDADGNIISKTYVKTDDVASHLDFASDDEIDSLFY